MIRLLKNIKNYQNHHAGFTITEVVVSALIFAIATAGILATASSLRRPAVESSEDVTAAFLAKRIFDDLRSQLGAETWNQPGGNFSNAVIDNPHVLQPIIVGRTTYQPSYNIVADPGGTQARKINLRIDW